jgi:hypothetical protein
MSIDFREVLRVRNVEPNSTWIRADGKEMFIVMPDDETVMHEALKDFVSGSTGDLYNPGWIRVIRLPVEGKTFARTDIMFVPYLCGQIDKGILTRIG